MNESALFSAIDQMRLEEYEQIGLGSESGIQRVSAALGPVLTAIKMDVIEAIGAFPLPAEYLTPGRWESTQEALRLLSARALRQSCLVRAKALQMALAQCLSEELRRLYPFAVASDQLSGLFNQTSAPLAGEMTAQLRALFLETTSEREDLPANLFASGALAEILQVPALSRQLRQVSFREAAPAGDPGRVMAEIEAVLRAEIDQFWRARRSEIEQALDALTIDRFAWLAEEIAHAAEARHAAVRGQALTPTDPLSALNLPPAPNPAPARAQFPPQPEPILCPKCKNPVRAGVKFCSKCGNQIN